MFYKYDIKGNTLYLYLDMKYEFASDLSIENENDLKQRTKNFILSNFIPFTGSKVYLVMNDKIVKSLDISNLKEKKTKKNDYSLDNFIIHLKLEDNSFSEMTLRDYLIGILLSFYRQDLSDEVYKSIAILYNTYAYKCMKEHKYIENSNNFASYKPTSYYKSILTSTDLIINYFNQLIEEVDSMFLTYQNNYILPFIHYSNNGETKANKKYPYLSKVKSLWDLSSPYYLDIRDIPYQEIEKKLHIIINKETPINIKEEGDNKIILLNHNVYTIEEFKNLLELKSTDIYLILYNDYLRIITKGFGNFYGLSIFGAEEIVKNKGKYYDILKYYFPKTKLLKYIEKET